MSLKRLQYCLKKCVGPSVLTFPDNEASKFILDYADKRHPLWSLMWVRLIPRSVPSWTGFQILVCDNFPVLRTTVGYLNCIDAFSTEMLYYYFFLFHQLMLGLLNIVESLKLSSVVCVFIQAINSKAIESNGRRKRILEILYWWWEFSTQLWCIFIF